jgi:hypothetical protein
MKIFYENWVYDFFGSVDNLRSTAVIIGDSNEFSDMT